MSIRTVYDLLVRYQIPRRSSGFPSTRSRRSVAVLNEVELRRLYLDEQQSIRAIAAQAGVSARVVYNALMAYRIPRRKSGFRHSVAAVLVLGNGTLDEATLRRLYEQEQRSIADIAAILQCTPSRIRSALVRWGIDRRRRGRYGHG